MTSNSLISIPSLKDIPFFFAVPILFRNFASDSQRPELGRASRKRPYMCPSQQKVHGYSRRAAAHPCAKAKSGERVTILGKRLQCALFLTLRNLAVPICSSKQSNGRCSWDGFISIPYVCIYALIVPMA